MRINAVKKLPAAARNMYNAVQEKVIERGKSEAVAARVALETVRRHYKPVAVTKSVSLEQTHFVNDSDNYIDVLLGKPMLDQQGEFYAPEFWRNSPMKPLTGDMEHINFRKAEGLPVDYPDEWDGFTPVADKFYHVGDELWAKVELPANHPFTPTFKKDWESGKYGASVETAYPEEAVEYRWVDGKLVPHVISGEITGFSFTGDPAIDTKPNKNE